MAIYQLIYRSRASLVHAEFRAEIARILMTSRASNPKHGITGCLAFTNDWFLQAIEGDEPAVSYLYDRIERDPRHSAVTVLARRLNRARSFPDWQMGSIDLATLPQASAQLRQMAENFSPDSSAVVAQLMLLLQLADDSRLRARSA